MHHGIETAVYLFQMQGILRRMSLSNEAHMLHKFAEERVRKISNYT